MARLSFDATKEETEIIRKIVDRAVQMASKLGGFYMDRLELAMDINACHSNGIRLKLQELLDANEFEFSHDVFGIRRHINRRTGVIEGGFLPRYAE